MRGVRPTARGMGLALAGAAALVAARGFGTAALAPVAIGFLLVALAAPVLVAMALTGVRLSRVTSARRPRAGDEVAADIVRSAQAPARIALAALEWRVDTGLDVLGPVRVRAERGGHLRAVVAGARRGEHLLPPMRLDVADPFGLATGHRRFGDAQPLLVVPRTLPATSDASRLGRRGRARTTPAAEDIAQLDGLREYRPGDPLSRVHWGQSAKRGRLHTKVFGPEGGRGRVAAVLLDVSSPSVAEADAELAVIAAASLACAACGDAAGRGTVALWAGGDAAPVTSDWGQAEARLARVRAGSGGPLAAMLRRAHRLLGPGAVVVGVTAEADPALPEAARASRRAGLELVVVLAGEAAAQAPALLAAGVPVLAAPDEGALAAGLRPPAEGRGGRRRARVGAARG